MTFSSIGDLASSFLLRNSGASVRNRIEVLGQELTTGLASNTRKHLRGHFESISGIERQMSSSQVRQKTLAEELIRTNGQEAVVENLRNLTIDLANDGDISKDSSVPIVIDGFSDIARSTLDQVLSMLNATFAGQSVFSGSRTDSPAFSATEDILSSLQSAIAGSISSSDVINQIDNWMNDPVSGFVGDAYLGDLQETRLVRVAKDSTLEVPTSANEPGVREMIRSLAIAAMANDPSISLSDQSKKNLISESSLGLRQAHFNLTGFQASIGYAQSEISRAQTQTNAELATSEQMKLSLLGVDEFETATRFQEAEMQLEKIYTLTARTARMSLLEYLR